MYPRHRQLCLAVIVSLLIPVWGCQAAPRTLSSGYGNLNGSWLFSTDPGDVGEKEGWQRADYKDSDWRALRVPGSWEPQGVTDPRPGQPPKPKGNLPWTDYDGAAWYRLHFTVPASWEGKELLLELGNVDDADRSFLNGQLVGAAEKVGTWRSYKVPAGLVKPGADNVLAVRVYDGGGPGGIDGPMLTLIPSDMVLSAGSYGKPDQPFEERFANPPAECRILRILHGFGGQTQDAQKSNLRQLQSLEFGGMVTNYPFSDRYLQDEGEWQRFREGVTMAKDAGMALWLYDEKGYPSGAAGSLTLQGHPEWEARGLLVADSVSDGGAISLEVPPGTIHSAAAYPVTAAGLDLKQPRDLSASVRDGKLTAELPAGKWHVMVFCEGPLYENTHAALSLAQKYHYINLLMPEPTQRFIELTYGGYAKVLGPDLGKYFEATFTDEPSLMSSFMRPSNWRPLPWAPQLPAEFQKRRGYALEPVLPALIADAGSAGQKARCDFWQTIGELVSENFFGQIQEACRKLKVPSGGHLLIEESLLSHVCYYGDFFRCIRRLDAPSIDCLTSIPAEVPWFVARLLSSAAELREVGPTMCETSDHSQRYRPAGDTRPVRVVTEEEIRGTCNRLLLNGINTITSYYSFNGLEPDQLRRLNTWIGRCSTALWGGHQVADIALVYPVESVWAKFLPARRGSTDSPEARLIESAYRGAGDSLFGSCRDFTYVDSQALGESAVDAGALTHGKLRWRVVVLPAVDTLPAAVWEKLADFWRTGGVVVALDALPANSETEFPSARVQALGREIFGESRSAAEAFVPRSRRNAAGGVGIYLPAGTRALLPTVLNAVLEPDVAAVGGKSPIRATHRSIDGNEVYFVINDSGAPFEGDVTVTGTGAGKLWNPATGEGTRLTSGTVKLSLEPYGGAILRFPSARIPERRKLDSTAGFELSLRSIPPVEPTAGRGEFVSAEVTKTADGGWRSVGTLTKSDVDTFLFMNFLYPKPIDLSAGIGLYVRTSVPAGQTTPSNLLVILEDADGGQYLADCGRPLSIAGDRAAVVAFSQLRLAGWSKDTTGQLDLDRIVRVSVGWGGYFGKEKEKVEFTVQLPQLCLLPGK
jgi:hypothetical protein